MMLLVIAALAFFYLTQNAGADTGAVPGPTDTSALDREIVVDVQHGTVLWQTGASLAGAGVSTGLLLLGAKAAIAGPIAAAVAGAIILIATLVSHTHLFANELVQHYENPFAQMLGRIIDAKDAGIAQGILARSDLEKYYNATAYIWNQYHLAMAGLIAKGGDWAVVAKQSLNNLNNEYKDELNGRVGMGGQFPNGFVTEVLAKMQLEMQSLPT